MQLFPVRVFSCKTLNKIKFAATSSVYLLNTFVKSRPKNHLLRTLNLTTFLKKYQLKISRTYLHVLRNIYIILQQNESFNSAKNGKIHLFIAIQKRLLCQTVDNDTNICI